MYDSILIMFNHVLFTFALLTGLSHAHPNTVKAWCICTNREVEHLDRTVTHYTCSFSAAASIKKCRAREDWELPR
jgi:uncharacterized protein